MQGESREEVALRKLGQFMNTKIARSIQYLGPINPLTSLYEPTDVNEVVAVEFDPEEVARLKSLSDSDLEAELNRSGDPVEGIKKVLHADFVSLGVISEHIRARRMFCGLSLAALQYGQVNRLIEQI